MQSSMASSAASRQTVWRALGEPAAPFAHRVGGCAHAQPDGLILRYFCGHKDDARPLSQPLRRSSPRRQRRELAPLAFAQVDRNRHLAHRQSPTNQLSQRIAPIFSIRPLQQIAFAFARRSARDVSRPLWDPCEGIPQGAGAHVTAGGAASRGRPTFRLSPGCAAKTPMLGSARLSGGLARAVKFERGIVENSWVSREAFNRAARL